ncbi:hypothetical protein MP228_010769 [Amoeboaphelidium protococcarum]|nr:hypothetical protein MP228_010769 [Amoeboaphelidium protococcarum]
MLSTFKSVKEAHNSGIWCVKWSTRVNKIITAGVGSEIKLWDGETMECEQVVKSSDLGVVSMDLRDLTGSTLLVTNTADGQLSVWELNDAKSGLKLQNRFNVGPSNAWCVSISPKGDQIAAGTHRGVLNIYSVSDGKCLRKAEVGKGQFIQSVAYSPDGAMLVIGTVTGLVQIYNSSDMQLMHTLPSHQNDPVRCLAFSRDSSLLLTGSDSGKIEAYDPVNADKMASLVSPATVSASSSAAAQSTVKKPWILSLQMLADGVHFISASSDKTVRVWSLSTKSCLFTLQEHYDLVWQVALNEKQDKLVSVSDDGHLIQYSVQL